VNQRVTRSASGRFSLFEQDRFLSVAEPGPLGEQPSRWSLQPTFSGARQLVRQTVGYSSARAPRPWGPLLRTPPHGDHQAATGPDLSSRSIRPRRASFSCPPGEDEPALQPPAAVREATAASRVPVRVGEGRLCGQRTSTIPRSCIPSLKGQHGRKTYFCPDDVVAPAMRVCRAAALFL